MGMGDPDRIPDEDIGASADSKGAHTHTVFRPSSSHETPTCFFGILLSYMYVAVPSLYVILVGGDDHRRTPQNINAEMI